MGCEGRAGTPDEFAGCLRPAFPLIPAEWKDDNMPIKFDHHKVELNWGGQPLTLETGKIARQADGAVLATLGETVRAGHRRFAPRRPSRARTSSR